MSRLHLPHGLPQLGCVLHLDANHAASFDREYATARWVDVGGDEEDAVLSAVALNSSDVSFTPTAAVCTLDKSAAVDNLFDGGGTLIVWIRCRGTGGGGFGHIATTRVALDNTGWYLIVRSTATNSYNVQFQQGFSSTNGAWRATLDGDEAGLPYNRWVCLAIKYNADSVSNKPSFFIDGRASSDVYTQSTPVGTRTTDAGQDLLIGNNSTGVRNFNGDIAGVSLYDRELINLEIQRYYQVTAPTFREAGMVLVDRVVTTSDVSSLTLGGIKSENDGTLFVTGKLIFDPPGIIEMRPRTGAALSSIRGRILRGEIGRNQATENDSTTGWPVANDNQTSQSEAVAFFNAWIWPAMERHTATAGAQTSARLYRSSGVLSASGYTDPVDNNAGGYWRTTVDSDAFDGIVFESPTGVNIKAGSEVSVYRLPQSVDPL